MCNTNFTTTPSGAKRRGIPKADLSEAVTSKEIVLPTDEDADYFRHLEQQGVLLNRPQIAAVRHVDGPLLTLAGAGSGKTSVLVCRTGYLISVKKVLPKHILLVTFTKKAAEEMKHRIAALPNMSRQIANGIQARTFHSFFLVLLKSRGYDQEILSNERYKQIIIKRNLREMGLEDHYQPETILSLLSLYKMNMVFPEEIPEKTTAQKEVKQVFAAYEQWKKDHYYLDFDDILVEAYYLLKRTPQLLESLQRRFQYIMVDEFQDTNVLQYELIKMLANTHQNLFVVGDDDQTIYTFNGAKNDIILEFDQQFPNAKTVTLDINYRSNHTIVGLGNEVIRHNVLRKGKTLKATKCNEYSPKYSRPTSTDDEAQMIAQDILQKVETKQIQYRDIAILHRTASYSRAIFEQLTLAGIPFVHYASENQIFYEQWPIKPVLSYLLLAIEPRNLQAISEILPTLYINREIGLQWIKQQELLEPKKNLLLHLTTLQEIKPFQVRKIKERAAFIEQLKESKPVHAIKKIRREFYDEFLETHKEKELTTYKETVMETLDELESSAQRFSTLEDFLAFIEKMREQHDRMKDMKQGKNENIVSLMTIHRAKGLEFPIVYLIGASEHVLPHITALEANKMEDMIAEKHKELQAIEEERRLCYVAITRAKEQLYISSPKFYRGKKVNVSRFLLEAYSQKASDDFPGNKSIQAWLCTSKICNAWQRITIETEVEHEKNCPLCGEKMKFGKKLLR